MAKIIGNTTATPNPRPDWSQTDDTKADFIKNKPTILTEEKVVELIEQNGGGGNTATLSITKENVIATAEQNSFTTSFTSSANLQVYQNGLLLAENINYTFADGVITLVDYAAEEGDVFIFSEITLA